MRIIATTALPLLSLAIVIAISVSLPQAVQAQSGQHQFSDGQHRVGIDVPRGTYVAQALEGRTCIVDIVEPNEAQRNLAFVGRAVLTIDATIGTFTTENCGVWQTKQLTSREKPRSSFGPGVYHIDVDILPGIYTASENSGVCFWFSTRNFSYRPQDTQDVNIWRIGQPIVYISPSDIGFYSANCGMWTRAEEQKPPPPKLQSFQDGSYLVGRHIAPGTYTADSGDDTCFWYRTAPVLPIQGDDSGGFISQGHQVVTILPTDSAFWSEGCGTWSPIAQRPQYTDDQDAGVFTIGAGTFAVGTHIPPGIYISETESEAGSGCDWSTLSAFSGRPQDISASGIGTLRGIVNITSDTIGFGSGCQGWVRIDDHQDAEPSNSFGDGEFVVGIHIEPGIYTASGAEDGGRCLWKRLVDFTGQPSDIVALHNVVGKTIARITPEDAGFESYGCGTWTLLPSVLPDAAQSEFSTGAWAIGSEVIPGIYTAEIPPQSHCFWSRLASFTGEVEDIAGSDNAENHAVLSILDSDIGVYSDGCGTWRQLGPQRPDAEPARRFSDGVYLVPRNIAPGTYIARNDEENLCYWSRMNSFYGDPFDRTNIYASRGPAIATITEDDVGFRTRDCGMWTLLQQTEADEQVELPATTFSQGTFVVNRHIAPGTYRATYTGAQTCTWRRLADFTWTDGNIAEVRTHARAIATIRESDVGFTSYGCGTWTPIESTSQDTPLRTSFGEGDYAVGIDIPPGAYISHTWHTRECRWSRLSSFDAHSDSVIAQGKSYGRWIVTISEEDAGFTSEGCGTWMPAPEDPPKDISFTFSDGMHRVGVDIVPGVYVAEVGQDIYSDGKFNPACAWKRLLTYSHEEEDTAEHKVARGRHIVQINPWDKAFLSQNCGEWRLKGT